MKSKENHERQICEAILNNIGSSFNIAGKPDKEEREKKAVDFYGTIGHANFFLEHTQIESYPEQIADDKQIEFLLNLEKELSGKLPIPGKYKLVISPRAVKGVKKQEKIKNVLKNWIQANAKNLELGSPSSAPYHFLRETPEGVPFEVTLYRFPGNNGELQIIRSVPETLEKKRKVRIKTAINDKCPKLKNAKKSINDLSILALESNDIALANHVDIGKALNEVLSQIKSCIKPDKIFLVETDIDPWSVYTYKNGSFVSKII